MYACLLCLFVLSYIKVKERSWFALPVFLFHMLKIIVTDCDGNYRETVRTILRVFKVTVLMMIMDADNEYNVIANIRCLTATVDFRFSLSYMQKSHLK